MLFMGSPIKHLLYSALLPGDVHLFIIMPHNTTQHLNNILGTLVDSRPFGYLLIATIGLHQPYLVSRQQLEDTLILELLYPSGVIHFPLFSYFFIQISPSEIVLVDRQWLTVWMVKPWALHDFTQHYWEPAWN
jgi:hypothetical protein